MSAFGAALSNFEGQYYRASTHRPSDAEPPQPLEMTPTPTHEHLRILVDPILKVLTTISSYEIMGNSTQVVVVSADSTLPVAFIAAQESRVTSCTIWDPAQHKFTGVMTISDYIRVLLYCNKHPEETDRVATLRIDQWRKMPEAAYTGPSGLICGHVEEPLVHCIKRMIEYKVNRLPIFATTEGGGDQEVSEDGTATTTATATAVSSAGGSPGKGPDLVNPSLVSLLTYSQVLMYLSRAIFADNDSVKGFYGGVQLAFSPATQAVLGATPPLAVPNAGSGTDIAWKSIFDVPVGKLEFPSLALSCQPQTITMQAKVVDVLALFIDEKLHSVPVVDEQNIIIDVINRSDVLRLESGGMYDVTRSLGEALSFRVGGRVPVFNRSDRLREVTLHFVQTGVQEMFCVDEKDAVVGRLSIVDIVKCFFAMVNEPEAET